MTRLVIAGAGGLGREMLDWVKSSPRWLERESFQDFVYAADMQATRQLSAPLISSIDGYRPTRGDRVVVAIGDPSGRRNVVGRLERAGAVFAAFVHDTVIAGENVSIPVGSMICPGVVIGSGTALGEHVLVNANSYVGHDSTVGDFATISPGCVVGGSAQIGAECLIGLGVSLRPHAKVGSGSTVGAGSTVVTDIPPRVIAFGAPARAKGTLLR